MKKNHSSCPSKIIPKIKQQIQIKRHYTWTPALWKIWLIHNNSFAKSCVEITVKLNKWWHEIMSLDSLFRLWDLTIGFNITFFASMYHFLSSMDGYLEWCEGKGVLGGERGFTGLLPGFYFGHCDSFELWNSLSKPKYDLFWIFLFSVRFFTTLKLVLVSIYFNVKQV